MIQILCEIHPSVIVENYDEVLRGKSRNADTYVAVMWALSRPGDTPENRLKGKIYKLIFAQGLIKMETNRNTLCVVILIILYVHTLHISLI